MIANHFAPSFDGQLYQFGTRDAAWSLQRPVVMAPPAYPTVFGYAAPRQPYHPSQSSMYGNYSTNQVESHYVNSRTNLAPQGYARAVAPPPYRVFEQQYANGQQGHEFENEQRTRLESRGRWDAQAVAYAPSAALGVDERSSWSRSVGRQESSHMVVLGEQRHFASGPRGVAHPVASRVAVDHDHPSFSRPPHRSSEAAQQEAEYQLVPNTSAVPPPPPIERSAVPLADLATEMVWDACLAAASSAPVAPTPTWRPTIATLFDGAETVARQRSPSARSLDDLANSQSRSSSSSSPRTPELYYGAIGEGRRATTPVDGCASDDSSPASSAPATPAHGSLSSLNRQQLGTFGIGFGEDAFETSIEAMRLHARKLSALNQKPSMALAAQPSPAFRQFVSQILTATLVAPEDLVLALYYISTLPASSMVPPTAASGADGLSASASAIKAAPFKLILGALMLANKTLQDNSYRNETFAAVSGIPLKDVNALEVFIFGALNFDVAVQGPAWTRWIHEITEQHEARIKGNTGNAHQVAAVLRRLLRAIDPSAVASPVIQRYSGPVITRSSTPVSQRSTNAVCTPPNSTFLLAGVDLDASGPLRSPLRFLEDEQVEADSPVSDRYRYRGETPSKAPFQSTTFANEKSSSTALHGRQLGLHLHNRSQ